MPQPQKRLQGLKSTKIDALLSAAAHLHGEGGGDGGGQLATASVHRFDRV